MTWWQQGGPLMWLLSAVGVVLAAVLLERTLALHQRAAGDAERADELAGLLATGGSDAAAVIAAGETLELTRGLWLARALCAALPLIGLLGTVTGIADAFAGIAATPGAVRSAGAGVATALITTQYAIALAIPGLAIEAWLRRRARLLAEGFAGAVALHRSSGAPR